jgi:arabinofuranan 3-O-arabinosyltransferase
MNGAVIDSLIGRPGLSDGYPVVSGVDYLGGDLAARPSSALDGDLATAWTTKFDDQVGATFTVTNPTSTSFDHLHLSVINDQEHSVPTVLNLTLDDGSIHPVEVPSIETVSEKGNVATVDVPTGALTSTTIVVTIAAERPVTTKEFFSGGQRILPIAIAELGLPTIVAPLPSLLPTTCRSGLATIDGAEQSFMLTGTVADAISRQALDLAPCGPTEAPQSLTPGDHQFVTAKGLDSAIDIDAMELQSVPHGPYTTAVNPPSTTVTSTGKNSYRVDIANASDPFWLVLGQSLSNGWKATVRSGESLGDPTLIDGFANGWQIDPAVTGTSFTVDISWTPQKTVWGGLALSFFWFIGLCAAAFVIAWSRRKLVRALPAATDPLLVTSELTNSTSATLRIGVLVGVTALSAFVGGLGVAIAMAIITTLLLWTRRRTAISALVVVGSIGGIVLLYTGLQFGHEYRSTAVWPSRFMFAHQLGLVAVLAVIAETVTRWLFRTRSTTTQRASDDD